MIEHFIYIKTKFIIIICVYIYIYLEKDWKLCKIELIKICTNERCIKWKKILWIEDIVNRSKKNQLVKINCNFRRISRYQSRRKIDRRDIG